MSRTLMKCGHTANSKTEEGKPACAICAGTSKDKKAYEVDQHPPELVGRKSRCIDCGKERGSRLDLPFFNHRPKLDRDTHYDGCKGWH